MRAALVSFILIVGSGFLLEAPVLTAQPVPDPPPVDSLITWIRTRLAFCDTHRTDMSYVATTRERKLDSDGSVKDEKMFRTRVYARRGLEREVLEGMWENGEPVSEKTLRKEREKREEERRKRAENADGRTEKKGGRRDIAVLEPFAAEYDGRYDSSAAVLDTLRGIETWKITVTPREDTDDLVRGAAWVDTEAFDPVAEEYEPAKLPSKLHALAFELRYDPIGTGCTIPEYFHIAGHGQALIFIKFNFEAEVIIDSVVIDPDLPDSLFEVSDR